MHLLPQKKSQDEGNILHVVVTHNPLKTHFSDSAYFTDKYMNLDHCAKNKSFF